MTGETIKKSENILGARHCQYFLMSFSLVIFFGMRTALSVGIIAMTEENPPDPSIPTYPDWNNTDTILSSFFWGYLVTQIIAGQLSEHHGPKWYLVGTMVTGSILNALIPVMATLWGCTGVIFCRVLQGLSQGFLYPCILNLVSKWTPVFERSRVSSFVYGGAAVGIIVSMPLTGFMSGSRWGWPLACYLYGGVGVAWAGVFAMFSANSPATHTWITEEERLYIEDNTCLDAKSEKLKDGSYKMATPWKAIFTSVPMWAIFVASCGSSWGSFTLLTEIPSYMDNIMDFNIHQNSQLSALPYVALLLTGLMGAPIADKLITNNIFTLNTTRKIFTSMGSFIPAAALFCLSFINRDDRSVATGLLILAVGTSAFTQCGYLVNPIDLSPNYAGTITGIVNCFSTVFSILGPLSVQFLGNDRKNPFLWRKVFRLSACIYIACGLFYVFCSSGHIQPWNNRPPTLKKDTIKNKVKADIYSVVVKINR